MLYKRIMMYQLNSYQLKQLLTNAAAAGAQKALECLAPTEESLTKNDVIRWFKRIGVSTTMIRKMEVQGLIKPERSGTAANSAIRYKRSDVQTALDAMKLTSVINQ